MTKEIRNFIEEIESVYEGEPWYGKSLMAVVKGADPKAVFKKPAPSSHSAYEITRHLLAWKELLVKRLRGDHKAGISMNSSQDWAPPPSDQNSAVWQVLINQLEQNQKELISELAKWKDEDLDKPFAETAYTLRTFLVGQVQHDIYHIGQIALALKNA